MKILKYPKFDILENNVDLNHYSMADSARTCYKSKGHGYQDDSRLISLCFDNGHHSVLEHGKVKFRLYCDRGVSHELVRHRLASYSQESTRYCNYSNNRFGSEITVVKPVRIYPDSMEYYIWEKNCESAEKAYFDLLDLGLAPENARSILPTCLATTVDMSCNLRELYHILDLRTARDDHPDIRYLMHGILIDMARDYPEIFKKMFTERNPQFITDFVKKGAKND